MASSGWRSGRGRVRAAVVAAVFAAGVLAASVGVWWLNRAPSRDEQPVDVSLGMPGVVPSPGPLAGAKLYVDPWSRAAAELRTRSELSPAQRSAIGFIASRPVAQWLGDDTPAAAIGSRVHRLVARAARAGSVPMLVAYAIPHRDCGGLSRGGFTSAAAYREWISAFATGLGDLPAVVVVEPDSLAQADCLSGSSAAERFALLRFAVDALTSGTRALVYLDGGNSRWQPAEVMAERLRLAGVQKARGFAVNVANFNRTDDEREYGQAIVAELGAPLGEVGFVIDVSRNGNGPVDSSGGWCNPAGRSLGDTPAALSGLDGVDGLLWVKTPGVSDGVCSPGQPPAGEFWPEYATGLVNNRP